MALRYKNLSPPVAPRYWRSFELPQSQAFKPCGLPVAALSGPGLGACRDQHGGEWQSRVSDSRAAFPWHCDSLGVSVQNPECRNRAGRCRGRRGRRARDTSPSPTERTGAGTGEFTCSKVLAGAGAARSSRQAQRALWPAAVTPGPSFKSRPALAPAAPPRPRPRPQWRWAGSNRQESCCLDLFRLVPFPHLTAFR